MTLSLVGQPDSDPEHDKYALATGTCIIILGLAGLFFNSSTLSFFCKFQHKDEISKQLFRIAAIFMSLADLLLSAAAAFIRGPGFIWPTAIYGDATTAPEGTTRCKVLSVVSSWLLSDLNMLAILPISCIILMPSKGFIKGIIGLCILLPLIETALLIIGIEKDFLDSRYTDTNRKCFIHNAANTTKDWEGMLDYFNMTVFNILPLCVHLFCWVSLCCRTSGLTRAKLQCGAAVVVTAIITWLPYGVTYVFMGETPSGPYALVVIGFYVSIVTNPLLYGFLNYKCRVLKEGCSECCCKENVEEVYVPAAQVIEPTVQTDIGSRTENMTDDTTSGRGERSRPQFDDRIQPLSSF